MKVRISDENGNVIQEFEDADAEACERWAGEGLTAEIAEGFYARMIVDVIER